MFSAESERSQNFMLWVYGIFATPAGARSVEHASGHDTI